MKSKYGFIAILLMLVPAFSNSNYLHAQQTLTVNAPATVNINNGQRVQLNFTAPSAGEYIIDSTNNGSLDPVAFSAASGTGSAATINDDGGEGRNFRFSRNLRAGEVFTFFAGVHRNTGNGSYTVTVQGLNAAQPTAQPAAQTAQTQPPAQLAAQVSADVPFAEMVNGFVTFRNLPYPEIIYYGANLGYFPPEVRDWIMNSAFTPEKMEQSFMLDSQLRVWWGEDNNTVFTEASYTIAPRFRGAGTVTTWGGQYRGGENIFNTYGEYAYYQTLRFKYQHRLYVDHLLITDPVFAEIIEFARHLSAEIEYDWASFSGYTGAPVRPTPGLRRHVCDGYANEVMEKAFRLPSVRAVQRWVSPNHAWNVLRLADGRTLYFDLTWFDNERINRETGQIVQTADYNWNNITFFEHLFRFSNVGYGTRQFSHNMGTLQRELTRD